MHGRLSIGELLFMKLSSRRSRNLTSVVFAIVFGCLLFAYLSSRSTPFPQAPIHQHVVHEAVLDDQTPPENQIDQMTASEEAFVPGELLVKFKADTSSEEIALIEADLGLKLVDVFDAINTRHYSIDTDVLSAVDYLSLHQAVEFAEPNFLRKPMGIPSDPQFSYQWALNNTGQSVNGVDGPADVDIDWPEATDLFTGTAEVVVAVIDTGIAMDHPEINARLWVNIGEVDCATTCDGIDNDGNGYVDDLLGWDFVDLDNLPLDEQGHGTLVASTIGASRENGEGGVGVSPTARLMAIRVLNDFGTGVPTSRMLNAYAYAAQNGAKVINASLGGSSYSSAESNFFDWLNEQGVLLVAAAGNGGVDGIGDNNDAAPFYPASYPQGNIISVAAVDRTGALSSFSNYGALSVDVAAPGTSIYGADVEREQTYLEDFEGSAAGWAQEHIPGSQSTLNWNMWTDSSGNSWATDSTGLLSTQIPYQANTDSVLISPFLNLPAVGPQLSFNVFYDTEYLYDWVFLEASADGVNWSVVDGVTGFCVQCSPISGVKVRYDLSAFAGLSGYLRFRIISDGVVHYDGVYVDNVEISGVTTFAYDGSQYGYLDGTSFAAPIVSGVAALIWSQFPGMSHDQVRNVLLQYSAQTASLSGMVETSAIVNAHLALAHLLDDNDSDGLTNGLEYTYNSDLDVPDTDGDGLEDGEEVLTFDTDPTRTDSDSDGLVDGEEVSIHSTNPARADTDGDGLNDGEEISLGLDPLNPDDCPYELCPSSSPLLKLVPLLFQ